MQNDEDDRRQRENLIAACLVLALVVFSIWLLHVLSGRHNCAPAGDGQ